MAIPLVLSMNLSPAFQESLSLIDWVTMTMSPGIILDIELLKGDREKEPILETLSDFTKVTTKISKEDIETHV